MESALNTRLLQDDYQVGPILGTGGFAVVRLALRKEDGLQVAVKTLKKYGYGHGGTGTDWPHQTSVPEALVKNEILVMMRIVEEVSPHLNVIHLLDVYDDPQGVHLVLELCEGGELFDRIVSQERYSEVGAAAIVRQIASGLSKLHQAQIVHRDLKPENCLFLSKAEESPLKIMDFGLSYIHNVTHPVVGMFGSIDYVSPEQLNQTTAEPASDMWSLGVILYILLCGQDVVLSYYTQLETKSCALMAEALLKASPTRIEAWDGPHVGNVTCEAGLLYRYPPFHARTTRDKQIRILTGHFTMEEESWKGVSPAAKQLVANLLAVDSLRRPSATELLSHPWVTGEAARSELLDEEVFTRLQTFNARRKFRATAYASLVRTRFQLRTKYLKELLGNRVLTATELEDLRVNFKRISSNGQTVTLDEFEEVLRSMSLGSLVPLAPRIFEVFDYNHDGWVDLRELICGLSLLRTSQGEEALQLCFQMYDIDNSGFISKDELARVLGALPEEYLPADISLMKMDELFDHMDADHDGRITFEEFRQALHLREALLTHFRPSPT